MADLNALIAQGAQFQAPPDPFVQYGKMQQLQQGEQTNQLNQMKMQEAQALATERNALRQLDPSSPDYENQLFKVNPTVGIAYRKEAATAAAQQAAQKAHEAQALKTSLDNHRSFLVGVNDQPSYDAWRALTTKNIPELASMLPTAFSPDAKNLLLQTADDISKKLNTPTAPITVAPSASVYDPITKTFIQAPGALEKPVAAKMHVVGKNLVDETGKVVFKAEAEPGSGVPKAPVGYRVTATGDLEAIPGGPAANKPMTDLQKQAYKKDFAADTYKIKSAVDTANELETLTDTLIGNPDKGVKAHPGLRGITGYAGVLPSLPSSDAAKAEQKLDTFKGKIKALGRSIASQDGKLGNMAVQEWQFISDAVQAINPRAGNLDEQMRDVVRQAKQLAKNMQGKFDLTYEDAPPVVGAPAPKPVARGALSPAEEAELAQLRKRFGK